MGLYLSFDGALGTDLASNSGWGDFTRWTEKLGGAPDLFHLVDYGWTGRPHAAAADLAKAMRDDPPDDGSVRSTAANLLDLLKGTAAEIVSVTNGLGPNDAVPDAPGEKSWPGKTTDANGAEHDANGQFATHGGSAAQKPASEFGPRPVAEKRPAVNGGARGRAALRHFAEVGRKVLSGTLHAEGAAKEHLGRQLDKLPRPVRWAVAGVYHAAFATYTAAQKAARAVAAERGLSPEHVEQVTHALQAADLVCGGKLLPMAVAAAGGAAVAPAAAFVPVGSLAYLAYSTARDPYAVGRAAKKAVAGAMHAVRGGKALDATDRLTETFFARAGREDWDWWLACFLAALDRTEGDAEKAISTADAAAGNAGGQVGDKAMPAGGRQDGTDGAADDEDAADEDDDLDAQIDAFAEVFAALYGEDAPEMLDRVLEDADEGDDEGEKAFGFKAGFTGTRRDALGREMYYQDGRRVPNPNREKPGPRRTAAQKEESHQRARAAISEVLKGDRSPEKAKELATHLSGMTVAQLNGLKQEYGLKASGKVKAELVAKLADRLDRGRREGPGESPQPKPEPAKPATAIHEAHAPEPGYTGTDTLGRKWRDGKLTGEQEPSVHGPDHIVTRLRAAKDLHAAVARLSRAGRDDEQTLARLKEEQTNLQAKLAREVPGADYGSVAGLQASIEHRERSLAHPGTRNKRALRAELDTLKAYHAEFQRIVAERTKVQEGRADKLHEAVAAELRARVKTAAVVSVSHEPAVGPKARASMDRAAELLKGSLQQYATAGELPHVTTYRDGDNERAHYKDGKINLSEGDGVGVAIHELMHGFEENDPAVYQAVQEFRRYRVKDEPGTNLAEKFPGSKFDPREIGYKDDFGRALPEQRAYYAGKTYGDRNTEILSVGAEQLFTDPAGFCAKDPEYAAFILGIMDGSLRAKTSAKR